jgi:hypothetical protein
MTKLKKKATKKLSKKDNKLKRNPLDELNKKKKRTPKANLLVDVSEPVLPVETPENTPLVVVLDPPTTVEDVVPKEHTEFQPCSLHHCGGQLEPVMKAEEVKVTLTVPPKVNWWVKLLRFLKNLFKR